MLAETADAVVSVPEIFNYWLQPGRIDVGFLGAAQLDRFGNINTTVIGGDYGKPKVRLPGAGGAPEIAASCREVIVVVRQTHALVRRPGRLRHLGRLRRRARATASGSGSPAPGPRRSSPTWASSSPTRRRCELTLTGLYPGVSSLGRRGPRPAGTWPSSADPEIIAAPTPAELDALRALQATEPGHHE